MTAPSRLLGRDVLRIGTTGLRTRPTRAILSALGIAIGTQIWLGGTYFTVVGILAPVPLAPELDRAALIGKPVATRLFAFDGSPTVVYERSADEAVEQVRSLLGPTISRQTPSEIDVSRPSDALAAKNAANQAFTGLLVGLGSVALLVGCCPSWARR